ncbi:MAG: DNA topoisomerase VI subunit B [Thermoprotei archaeon]|nr:MAG: DNA topoisomerase VI subunit B [Thermoprotei archaeon]
MSVDLARETYRGLSPAEFFYRNKEIAGFSNPARALYQTIRELVENALDATELHGILPDIKIFVDVVDPGKNIVKVRVEDNGIGVPKEEVPKVFGMVFYGSKYKIRQSRGVFGLGVKMAVLYAQITTGKPVYVKSSTIDSKEIYEFEVMIDVINNRPIVLSHRSYRKDNQWHGTVVELTIEGNWSYAKKRIEEYIKRTALITPYANIYFKGPDIELAFTRATRRIPKPPREGLPHPKGVDIEMLKQMIAMTEENLSLRDFLIKYFDGVGKISAETFLKWAGFNPEQSIKTLTLEQLDELARKMREYSGWKRPKDISLSPLGEELLRRGIEEVLKPEFIATVTRKPSSYIGNPFVVETAIAWGGKIPPSEKPILYRFANKIPLLYDEGADVTRKIVDSIDWSVYKVKFPAPLLVVVHICSTKIPFKGVGKEAIAEVPELEEEIEAALRECARKLRMYITKKEKELELALKRVTFMKYLPEVASALSYITGKDRAHIERNLIDILEAKLRGS